MTNLIEGYVVNTKNDAKKLATTGKVDRAGFLRLAGGAVVFGALPACGLVNLSNDLVVSESEENVLPTRAVPLVIEDEGKKDAIVDQENQAEVQVTQEQLKPTEVPNTEVQGPMNTPETGEYNAEALQKWQELEPQPFLSEKLGVNIMPSRYVRGEGAIAWHADVAKRLGFRKVAIVASPPEFVDHTGITPTASMSTLDGLVQYYEYDRVFGAGFDQVHITCDVGGASAANGWNFPGTDFTQEQLGATYQEVKATANYILGKFGGSNTEFVMGGPNEIELLAKGGYNPGTEDANMSPQAVDNAVAYFDTVHSAIADANSEHPNAKPIKTGLEVLQIRTEMNDTNAVTGLDVASRLAKVPDYVTLSAWQFSGKGPTGGYLPGKAVETMQAQVPGAQVLLTEYNVADSDRRAVTEGEREAVAGVIKADIESALGAGAKCIYNWGLTCYNGSKNFGNNDEYRGLWFIRPDGSMRREVYETLKQIA